MSSLERHPQVVPPVFASHPLITGAAGQHEDPSPVTENGACGRAPRCGEEVVASGGDSGDAASPAAECVCHSSGSSGPRCPGPAGWSWVSRQSRGPVPR